MWFSSYYLITFNTIIIFNYTTQHLKNFIIVFVSYYYTYRREAFNCSVRISKYYSKVNIKEGLAPNNTPEL